MSTSQTHTAGTTASTQTTSGEATGAQAGNAIKSAYNAVHGGLEKLRGETLAAADAAGDAVSDRPQGSSASRTETSAAVAQKGDAEMNQGVAGFSSMQGSRDGELHQPSDTSSSSPIYGRPLPIPPVETAQYYQTPALASGSEKQSLTPPPTHPSLLSSSTSSTQVHPIHHVPHQPAQPVEQPVTSQPATGGIEYPAPPARTAPDSVINNSFNDGRAIPGQTGKMLSESGFGKLKSVLQSANGTIENLRKQSLALADSAGEAIADRKASSKATENSTR